MVTSKGVLLQCNNNGTFPYHRLVPICAFFIKRYLNVPVCVAADVGTMVLLDAIPNLDKLVDMRVVVDLPEGMGNRLYYDSTGAVNPNRAGAFLNTNRHQYYEITPFEETLMIDLDYLVLDDRLNMVWGSEAPIRINYSVAGLTHDRPPGIQHMHALGIPQFWATVAYFRKSPEAKTLFEGVGFIRDNYQYFADQYRFSGHLYRNDFAYSIMAHAMNGSTGENFYQWPVQALPDPHLLFAWDEHPMVGISEDHAWFSADQRNAIGERLTNPVLVQNQSVHVMNKQSLLDVAEPWVMKQMELL